MSKDEAMKLALDALEQLVLPKRADDIFRLAITALRQAIEQTEATPCKPLTEQEIGTKWLKALADTKEQTYLPVTEFARAIEATHGIKENT